MALRNVSRKDGGVGGPLSAFLKHSKSITAFIERFGSQRQNEGQEPFTRVIMTPAMIFVSRFALNGSSRHVRIMAMGISVKTAEPSRAHCGRCGVELGEPMKANRASTSAYR
jgi:hypothetical protein